MSFLIILSVLLLCVGVMAVGVMNGRKPIQHCGSSALKYKGKVVDCPLCSNTECPNQKKGVCGEVEKEVIGQ
jgi:hypothetical protein